MTTTDELRDELDQYVAGEEYDDEGDEPIAPPPDADVANAMMRRRRRLLGYADEVRRVAAGEIERISAWRDDRLAGLDRQVERLDRALEGWTRAVNRSDPRRKTIKLPNGDAKLRAGRDRVVVADAEAFGFWQLSAAIEKVAAYLADGGPLDDERPQATELVTQILTEQVFPFGRIKVEPDRQTMATLTKGPKLRDDEEETAYALLDGGEAVAGVEIVTPKLDTFSVTSAAIPVEPAGIE